MDILSKLFGWVSGGSAKSSSTLEKSVQEARFRKGTGNDMLLPVQLVNSILLVTNSENPADNQWWTDNLPTAFRDTNLEFCVSMNDYLLSLGPESELKMHSFIVPFEKRESGTKGANPGIEIASLYFKQNHPNDSYIFQIGALDSPGKSRCHSVYGITFTTPNNLNPFVTIIELPTKIMPSDKLEYPKGSSTKSNVRPAFELPG